MDLGILHKSLSWSLSTLGARNRWFILTPAWSAGKVDPSFLSCFAHLQEVDFYKKRKRLCRVFGLVFIFHHLLESGKAAFSLSILKFVPRSNTWLLGLIVTFG